MESKPVVGYYGLWVALTYLSVIVAILGIHFALIDNVRYALVCLMISGVCDMFDGRVASLFKKRNTREKHYGIQIDSLADIISFGVLPAAIGYEHYAPSGNFISLGWFDTAIFPIYLMAALIRLAYYNVIETELHGQNKKRTYYEGLPVTSVAFIIPLVYALCHIFDKSIFGIYNILLIFLSVAFVLKIRVPKPRARTQIVLCVLGLPVIIYILFLCFGK
ncbi:MAG: CDP-alcohol phosphatidyltransferase family protein [Chitinispirillales bacterium]|nr:CDP-alcohol phosphatidyltransferase family protein [Chitinispirillales bacterium]